MQLVMPHSRVIAKPWHGVQGASLKAGDPLSWDFLTKSIVSKDLRNLADWPYVGARSPVWK